jgi:hypothetical protein
MNKIHVIESEIHTLLHRKEEIESKLGDIRDELYGKYEELEQRKDEKAIRLYDEFGNPVYLGLRVDQTNGRKALMIDQEPFGMNRPVYIEIPKGSRFDKFTEVVADNMRCKF